MYQVPILLFNDQLVTYVLDAAIYIVIKRLCFSTEMQQVYRCTDFPNSVQLQCLYLPIQVVDLGYHDMSFIKYLKELSGVRCILGVDIESIPLRCSSDLIGCDDYGPRRETPLQVTVS